VPDFYLGRLHTIAPNARPQGPVLALAEGGFWSRSEVDAGAFQVVGDTVNTGTPETPVGRRVRLHDQPSGRVVAEQWSNPVTGAYAFTLIRQGTYYVTSFDHTGQYNGVISTDVQSEPMP
jgi:hypothetical protein